MKYMNLFEDTAEKESLENFLAEMAKNTKREIVEFLLENPLYRGMKNETLSFYGYIPVKKNRQPLDTPVVIQQIIDEYLSEKGFRALRSNSIFVTGNLDFAKKFGFPYVIFPPKKFYFTWNTTIRDFTQMLDISADLQNENSIFYINLEEAFTNKKFYMFFQNLMNHIFYDTEILPKLQVYYEERNFQNLENTINDFLGDTNTLSKVFYDDILSLIRMTMSKNRQKDIIYLNRNSKFLKEYTDKNFFNAVKSGNEIMITNSIVYYIRHDFFESRKKEIKKILNKYW